MTSHKNEYGCLMGIISDPEQQKLIEFSKNIISKDILFNDPKDPSFGYEDEPHVTIKYGFTPDLTKRDIYDIVKDSKPFYIDIIGLSEFKSDVFDVVKFDVDVSNLQILRDRANKYKNEDKFPVYHPHITCAYVKKGKFNKTSDVNFSVLINKFKYSGQDGSVIYINI